MLTNLGSLPLDRIHNMLKMFVSHDTITTKELTLILQHLCASETIEQTLDGQYSLPNRS